MTDLLLADEDEDEDVRRVLRHPTRMVLPLPPALYRVSPKEMVHEKRAKRTRGANVLRRWSRRQRLFVFRASLWVLRCVFAG
jgi:hypothetical protein